MYRRVLNGLGSLKLAVILLSAIALVCAVATFYESATNTRTALLNVYQSWWFNVLLLLLALNIGAAALTRWPWQRKHIGFVITHAGLIILLGGCSAAFHYGTEGIVELRVGQSPANAVRLDDQALTMVDPKSGARETLILRPDQSLDLPAQSVALTPSIQVNVDEYVPHTVLEPSVTAAPHGGRPAVRFSLKSEMAEQDVSQWLVAGDPQLGQIQMGPASIRFVRVAEQKALDTMLTPPAAEASRGPVLTITVAGQTTRINPYEDRHKHLDLADGEVSAHVVGYWPDFRLDEDHKPTTISNEPNNPAAAVILSQGGNEQRYFVFANPELPPIMRTTQGEPIDAELSLRAGPATAGSGLTIIAGPVDENDQPQLHYVARSRAGFKAGDVEIGEVFSPGWMDFEVTISQLIPHATVGRTVERAPVPAEGNIPAVVVTVNASESRETSAEQEPAIEAVTEWIRFGQARVIEVAGRAVHLVYGWDIMTLPFTVALEDFVVEWNEGTKTPAGWTSKVVFEDAVRGISQRADIWMNHPSWFSGYKFAQASWNPNDLNYTALQVKKDPLWVSWLTWIGSTLIVLGIVLMFWFRKWYSRGPKRSEPVTASAPSAAA